MKKNKATPKTVKDRLTALRKEWGWTSSELLKALRPARGGSGKGSSYERELCKRFSLWWSADERDDIFWRSSGSGARAKVRGRAGAQTAGQHGDMAATDPSGAALIDLLTFEFKRGYNEHTFQDILDRPIGGGVQVWEKWFGQAVESNEQAGSFAWFLVTRRDRRNALVWFPHYLLKELRAAGAFGDGYTPPFTRGLVSIKDAEKAFFVVDVVGMTLDNFLSEVTPHHLKEVAKKA